MQKNDEATTTLSRARSDLMWETLFAMNIKSDTVNFNGNEYHIIDSNFRNWITQDKTKLASIGGIVLGREILLINHYEGNLKTILRNYRYSLLYKTAINQIKSENDISNLFKDLSKYVSQILNPNATEVQKIIDNYKKNSAQCLISNNNSAPFIDFEIFLANKVGVCRHYAVLCCLVTAYLVNKNILPSGQIMLERTDLSNSGHAWMRFIYNNKQWIIDATKCLNPATANNAVTLNGHTEPEEPLAPTQPLTPDNASPASQSCDCADICAVNIVKTIRPELNHNLKQSR